MLSRRFLLPLALLALAAALLIFLRAGPGAETGAVHTAEEEEAPPALGAAPAARDPERSERQTLSAIGEEAQTGPPPDLAAGSTLLTILLVAKGSGDPIVGERIWLYPWPADTPEAGVFFDWMEEQGWGERIGDSGTFAGPPMSPGQPEPAPELVSDESGMIRVSPPPGVPFSVQVVPTESMGRASAEVQALALGERRALKLEVELRRSLILHGRVVEEGARTPIPGAEVGLFSNSQNFQEKIGMDEDPAADGPSRIPAPLATSDADGRFRLELGSWNETRLWIRKDGRSPVFRELSRDHESPAAPMIIGMVSGAGLQGMVLEAGLPVTGLTVELATEAYRLPPEPSADLYTDCAWRRRIDAGGGFEIPDLPPGAPLRIRLLRTGQEPLIVPDPLILQPGELRQWSIDLLQGSPVSGTVVDQYGGPVADARVVAIPATEAPWSSPESKVVTLVQSFETPAATQVTDVNGRFALGTIPEGEWLVGVLPEFGRETEYTSTGLRVEVQPSTGPLDLLVPVWRGLSITGRVRGPNGEVASKASVFAIHEETQGFYHAGCGEDGSFRLGPLISGSYRLSGQAGFGPNGGFADSDPGIAEAGATDVELSLHLGSEIRGRVLDAATGNPVSAEITVAGNATGSVPFIHSQEDGGFAQGGLRAGIYELCATAGDGRIGIVRGLELLPGQVLDGVEIRLEAGGFLVLTLPADTEGSRTRITWQGSWILGSGFEPGVPVRVTVPAGEIQVQLFRATEEQGEVHILSVAPGETVELDLTAERG